MPLTPAQFNKLTTKEELNEIKIKVDRIDSNIENLVTAVDHVFKKLDTIEHAFVSNMAAHDRFEERIAKLENVVFDVKVKENSKQVK